jgi:diadenosine tetraphosphatase ApaH/serine/threonine PP2A family protein phosphatase
MKLAVITDVHANREAFEAVLEHAADQGVERYALLGDFVGYGADPGWVVEQIRTLVGAGAIAIQGNHDEAVVNGPRGSMVPQAREVVTWTRQQLSAGQIDFLARLPLSVTEGDQLFVHANNVAPAQWGYVMSRLDAATCLHATTARHIFCGHVHAQGLYHLTMAGASGEAQFKPGTALALPASSRWLAIAGSAGQPRDGNTRACYATFDTDTATLTFWRVPYNHIKAAAKIIAARLPSPLAERLLRGE